MGLAGLLHVALYSPNSSRGHNIAWFHESKYGTGRPRDIEVAWYLYQIYGQPLHQPSKGEN